MSVLTSRPVLRWAIPATAAVVIVGGGAAVGTFAAEAEPSLPPRTAAQLLVDLQTSRLEGLSGTVVQRADLGLPPLAELAGRALPEGGELATLLTGTHTLRIWHSGPDRQRVSLLDTLGERDLIRHGRDLWVWNSRTNSGTHHTLPAEAAGQGRGGDGTRGPAATALPATPQEAADLALAAIDPSTEVSVGRSATVAGRDSYELVLDPRDPASLVDQVRVAIDAEKHVPLRFEVFATDGDRPAFEVAFTQVDFKRPDEAQFAFNPPPGATITEQPAREKSAPSGKPAPDRAGRSGGGPAGSAAAESGSDVVGSGWGAVLVARIGTDGEKGRAGRGGNSGVGGSGERGDGFDAARIAGMSDALPAVRGDWGSGRLLSTRLVSVLFTDDGRMFVGAVTPQRLYEVAAQR